MPTVAQAGSLEHVAIIEWSHVNVQAPFVPAVRSHVSIVQPSPSLQVRGVAGFMHAENSVLHVGTPSQKFQNAGFMQSASVVQLWTIAQPVAVQCCPDGQLVSTGV
jgi:hypothetical protein